MICGRGFKRGKRRGEVSAQQDRWGVLMSGDQGRLPETIVARLKVISNAGASPMRRASKPSGGSRVLWTITAILPVRGDDAAIGTTRIDIIVQRYL